MLLSDFESGMSPRESGRTREREFDVSHIPQEHNGIEPGFARENAQSKNLYESVHPGFLEEYHQYTIRF